MAFADHLDKSIFFFFLMKLYRQLLSLRFVWGWFFWILFFFMFMKRNSNIYRDSFEQALSKGKQIKSPLKSNLPSTHVPEATELWIRRVGLFFPFLFLFFFVMWNLVLVSGWAKKYLELCRLLASEDSLIVQVTHSKTSRLDLNTPNLLLSVEYNVGRKTK